MRKTIPLLVLAAAALVFVSRAAAAVIVGTRGDDTLDRHGHERDHILAKAGNDTVTGKAGNDLVIGQRGNDSLSGDEGNDMLFGGPGNDDLDGGAGNDFIYTGSGTDTVDARRRGRWRAGKCGRQQDRRHRLWSRGGSRGDQARRHRGQLRARQVPGGTRRQHRGTVQKGTRGDDTLTGGDGRDILLGLAGNDTLNGLGGADFLFGMAGNDTLNGDDGRDRSGAAAVTTRENGGDGTDWIHAGFGHGHGERRHRRRPGLGCRQRRMVDTIDCGDGSRPGGHPRGRRGHELRVRADALVVLTPRPGPRGPLRRAASALTAVHVRGESARPARMSARTRAATRARLLGTIAIGWRVVFIPTQGGARACER